MMKEIFENVKAGMMGVSARTKVVAMVAVVALVAAGVVAVVRSDDTGDEIADTVPVEDSREPVEVASLPGGGGPPAPPAAASPVGYDPEGADRRVLVELADGVDPATLVAASPVAGPVAGGEIIEWLTAVGNVVVVGLPEGVTVESATDSLAGFDGVVSAEGDAVVNVSSAGSQVDPTWGLTRIDQPTSPTDSVFNYRTDGAGVVAYVVDTGLRSTHTEFTGRVQAGYSVISDGRGTEECTGEDAGYYSGHGTHVAGTIAGTTYGVAKGATVVPIRVFDCAGAGTWSGIASAVNWIVANHDSNNPGARGVINMSLSGGGSSTMDTAVRSAVSAGFPVAVSAGNDDTDACTKSPARVAEAMTVGATNASDVRASFSNFGTCLDVFAPGVDIVSAFSTSDSAVYAWGGTSMASPHVAGAAVQLLALNSGWTPAQVADEIVNTAQATVTIDSGFTAGTGSPNRMLFLNPNIAASADSSTQGYQTLNNTTHSFHTTPGTPATIYRRTIADNTVAGSLTLNSGENSIGSAVISSDGTTGYFAVSGTPAKIVKVNLSNMTRTSDVTLHSSENYSHAAVISSDDTRGYFATGDSPAKVVAVNLSTMARVGATALTYADGTPRSAARITDSGLFGTNTSPGKVVRMYLSGDVTSRDTVVTLESGENNLTSAVAIPNTTTVLFGTNTAPGKVVQVGVGGLVERRSVLTLTAGNDYLVGATVAPDRVNAYFMTNTSPGRVIKVPTGISS